MAEQWSGRGESVELINGRTAEEIKESLMPRCGFRCEVCPVDDICLIGKTYKDALALIERLEAAQPRWHSGSCPPRERGEVLVIARGKPKENIQLLDAYELAEYVPGEGWIFEAYPEWENGEVRWWMPLPEEPKEGA